MDENNKNQPSNPVAPADWLCKSCQEVNSPDEASCNKCGYCLWCCDSWDCTKCKNQFCGDLALRCDTCAYCKNCCSCWNCDGCHRQQTSQTPKCRVCNLCTNGCCHCFRCNRCNEVYASFNGNGCRDCRHCNNCCQCSGIDRYSPEMIMFHKAQPVKGFRRNPSSRFIAAEIEIANLKNDKKTDIFKAVTKWEGAIVDDGSLPTTGFEINSAPAQGDKYCEQIEEICAALESQGAIVSNQCGLHVHIDARDYTYYDLRRLLLLYRKIEYGLFEIVAPERRYSKYCHPCGENYSASLDSKTLDAEANKKQILRNVYQVEVTQTERRFMQSVRIQKYNGARYSALNMHSWFYRGTIESRMHQGSKSPEHIINWGILWAGILDYALKNTEKQINLFPLEANKQLNTLIAIAPTNSVKDWVLKRAVTFKKRNEVKSSAFANINIPTNSAYGLAVQTPNRNRAVPPLEVNVGQDYDVDVPDVVTNQR